MWAIMKSPLIIGCPISDETPKDSLEILENEEVIAINQDSLGEAATLALRNTEGEWDIWVGNLSENRKVVGISNWKDQPQSVTFDLHVLGIGSASARDVWAGEDVGSISGEYTVELTAHEMQILVLTDIEATDGPQSEGYYGAQDAKLAGGATLISCSDTDCLPSNNKVGNIDDESKVTLEGVSSSTAGKKLVGIDFINYEYSFHDAWGFGTNTRNVTIQVNDEAAKKWTFPLGGNDWFESGRLTIELDGFTEGDDNVIVFAGTEGHWAPEFVGLELFA
jgi:alpha-galactosidase